MNLKLDSSGIVVLTVIVIVIIVIVYIIWRRHEELEGSSSLGSNRSYRADIDRVRLPESSTRRSVSISDSSDSPSRSRNLFDRVFARGSHHSHSRAEPVTLDAVGRNKAPMFNPDYNADVSKPISNVFGTFRVLEGDYDVGYVTSTGLADGSQKHKFKIEGGEIKVHFPANTGTEIIQPLGTPDVIGTRPEQAFPEIASFVSNPGPFGNGYAIIYAEQNATKQQMLSLGGSWKAEGRLHHVKKITVRCGYLATFDSRGNPQVDRAIGCLYRLE